MNRSAKWLCAATLIGLAGLAACGGGSSTPPPQPPPAPATATSLVYTDPAGGTYLLKRNAGLSTASHLVLDLVGPAGTGSGVSAAFSTDAAKVSWSNVASTDAAGTYVQNGTQFQLGAGTAILKAKVADGDIQAAVAQKGTGSPVSLNGPLLRLALDLKTGQAPGAVAIGAAASKCQVLDGTGAIVPITVSVGTLAAQ